MRRTEDTRRDRKSPNIDSAYPCIIFLTWNHNHTIIAADALRRLHVLPKVDLKLENLYKNDHSPATALRCIKMEIEDNLEGDRLDHLLANRSVCPDYRH